MADKAKAKMADIVQDGDITLQNVTQTRGMQIRSNKGSVTIEQKIDDHSDVTIHAAVDVTIVQKIDQHSAATITAGRNVSIGQKIDQHSLARITAGANILIGQKVDQHSVAFLSAPHGSITISQGISAEAVVHSTAKHESLGTIDSGASADHNMNAAVDPTQVGPDS
ncbi:MAG TPA: hypothetical protein VG096_07600 [Bryobacteraceae bacterium]|jgi:hypothetical protein|nr:hypothetical protein [Bryobacteraceae bacterium]